MDSEFRRAKRVRVALSAAIVALCCFRFAHVGLLWSDEDYHLAAAIQILHGKTPYRDFWYDKPPLDALFYVLIGGRFGWPLRVLDAAYILAACALIYRLARALWGEAEAWTAALLLAFFTTFYLASAVIPFSADALMLVPHLAAIYCAQKRRPFWTGLWAGVGFLMNAKALFVLAACAVWLIANSRKTGTDWVPSRTTRSFVVWWRASVSFALRPEWLLLLAGFAVPTLAGLLWAVSAGAWNGYAEQVWRWGVIYARDSPATNPFALGVVRTFHWVGFHAALVVASGLALGRMGRSERWRLGSWAALSFAAVCLGGRFAPRYFLQLLPVMTIVAARGLVLVWQSQRRVVMAVLAIALLVPLVRFGPRYASLAYDDVAGRQPQWGAINMELDGEDAARQILAMAKPGDTLFVWGYRPDIYVYTRLIAPGLFWDSQPLTGVPADRHLTSTSAIYGGPAAANRAVVARSKPVFLVDGLGLLNPKLKPEAYPELRAWLANYRLVGRTKLSLLYRRID